MFWWEICMSVLLWKLKLRPLLGQPKLLFERKINSIVLVTDLDRLDSCSKETDCMKNRTNFVVLRFCFPPYICLEWLIVSELSNRNNWKQIIYPTAFYRSKRWWGKYEGNVGHFSPLWSKTWWKKMIFSVCFHEKKGWFIFNSYLNKDIYR